MAWSSRASQIWCHVSRRTRSAFSLTTTCVDFMERRMPKKIVPFSTRDCGVETRSILARSWCHNMQWFLEEETANLFTCRNRTSTKGQLWSTWIAVDAFASTEVRQPSNRAAVHSKLPLHTWKPHRHHQRFQHGIYRTQHWEIDPSLHHNCHRRWDRKKLQNSFEICENDSDTAVFLSQM